jgi:hypothetical protein
MPHTKDDAVLRTSGQSWPCLPLANPREQIRLLHFRPGSDDDDIYANVEVCDLDSAPAFNAISYTWGVEPPHEVIKIDDVPVKVRPNCHYALWQARLHSPGSRVWLDAICIDQSDLVEKASQVAIMGDIYAKATNVLACIGPADDSSNAIRDALKNLDAVLRDLPEDWWDALDSEWWEPPEDEANTVRQISTQFNKVCDRSYFSRVWIVQELFEGRGRTVLLCGSYQLDLDKLRDLSTRLYKYCRAWTDKPYHSSWLSGRLSELETLLTLHDDSDFSLSGVLVSIDEFECHDVRDRIFGTLRLVDWARFGKSIPIPDYQVSSLQLAFDMMSLVDAHDLATASTMVDLLDLHMENSYFESWLRTKQCDTIPPTFVPPPSEIGPFFTSIYGAHHIQRDDIGRLSVALEAGIIKRSSSFRVPEGLHLHPDRPETLDSVLALHGLQPIYTGDTVSALASSETLPGDVILNGLYCHLVLRPQDDGLSFDVVGPAHIVNSHGSRQYDRMSKGSKCICWQEEKMKDYEQTKVRLGIDMSYEDAIAAVGSFEAVVYGNGDMLTYLKHYSLGQLRKGAVLTDMTMSYDDLPDRMLGPSKALCERHRAAERYRVSRQALWYNITANDGEYVYVKR